MSYEKHTWETGETITAEKLNNLEDGVASSGEGVENLMVVNVYMSAPGSYASDKTFNQINTFIENGGVVILKDFSNVSYPNVSPWYGVSDGGYSFSNFDISSSNHLSVSEYRINYRNDEITFQVHDFALYDNSTE